ncbi:TPA: hypothetical protein CPT87_09020 [Candidatus Gastranaerophilales bacterium HUM_5]|nr:MAG TPA: hypothetical protein CPT99_01240 [Candidatus Gastranaerophilales bacterium HUM_4]DAA89435.1 MAG TPA: hypothetical protein CPT87_09020 [Candidatus Gastranaerophilales bacterium HUM_5]DAA97435.1 MAG TPA: hypothetical protein CPT88_02950 [Candidatus Gastranaerophilales bacterium HUM_8]DAB04254.1 MAG TPA: hypothetical protein CPT89_02660 [Candidatus Gastranaerophilales bacterium HUM_11]
MADINNFTEITENFDTIKTLLNSIRAQGILNTSDVDKLLAGINSKLERLNTEEDIDLIKIFLSELKQNLDERHSVLLSKFGAIESLFSNLLKNSADALKSSEVKELFDIVATNLSVFSREVVSQKETLTDITLRLDAMRSDDSQKKEIVKNITFLKNDIERLTNGFDSIVLSLNENFKTIIKTISSIDPSENINKFGKELEDIVNSSNTILSALQMLDKKNLQIEDALRGLATQDDLNSAKQWISDLASQEQTLAQSIDNLADKYYKIDNLADKIDASVDIIAGLKTVISDRDEQSSRALLDKLAELENTVRDISTNQAFEEFKLSLETALKGLYEGSSAIQTAVIDSSVELQKVNDAIRALDLNVSFKSLASDLSKSEQNVRDHVSVETGKVIQLVDVNATRTLNEISSSADNLTERINQAHSLISALCEKSFTEVEDNIAGLKNIVSQIDENNVSANNAIFSNITDRLAMFENSLKMSLEKQEDYVANSSSQLLEQINNIKDLSGVLDYKIDASVIEINNAKVEFSGLKAAVEDVLALDFVNKVKDLKVDLYAVKQDLANAVETSSGDLAEKFSNDLFGKYELLISKLDSVETEIKQAQTTSLNGLKAVLDNISSSIVDILSYVSSRQDISIDAIEAKLETINRAVSDNTLNYVENVRDIVDVIRTQVENNIKSIQEDTNRQIDIINTSISTSSENIRNEIQNSYNKLIEVQENFDEIKETLSVNNNVLTDNINGVLSTANTLRTDFDAKLGALKNAILDKVAEFQQDFTCENADKISEIKFVSENLHSKSIQNAMDIKAELKGEIAQLIGTLRLNVEELTEQIAGTGLKVEGANNEIISYIKNDFGAMVDNSVDELGSKVTDFSANIEARIDDIVSKFGNMEEAVDNLTNKTTSSLTSTLAKILDNFVSLKALIGTLNDKAADDLKKNVDILTNDFAKLRDKVDTVDANIDEDLTRQLALIETNFEMLNQSITNLFAHNDALLGERLNIGLTNISGSIKETVVQNLEQYKGQVEELFNNVSAKNEAQANFISEKVLELNKILQNTLVQQNANSENSLKEIANNLKHILDENIELTSADYDALKNKLDTFAKEIEEKNNVLSENFKAQLDDIAKFVDSGLEIQAREVNTKFNEIIENVQVISSAEEALKADIAEKVASISGDINTLKTDITNSMSSNSTLLAGKLEEILSDLSAKDDNLFASLSKLSTEAQNLIQAQQSASISKADEVLAELRELIKNATSINQENIETQVNSSLRELSRLIREASTAQQENIVGQVNNILQNIDILSKDSSSAAQELENLINSVAAAQQENVNARINSIIQELQALGKDAGDRAALLRQSLAENVTGEMDELFNKIHSLFEEHSLNLLTQLSNVSSKTLEDLNAKAIDFKASFETLNERLDKDEISRMNIFQSQLKELSNTFNVLIGEAKDVTKSEVSAISETLIKNSKEAMEEVEQSIEDKVNSILAASADIAAGELQSMEMFTNKILEQIDINKQTAVACRDFVNNFVKSELNIIADNIEKEADVIVKDLLEQMNMMREFQKDELSKLTIHIESSVEDYIYNHINDLKSYIDVKTDSSGLNSKIDSIGTDLRRSAEDMLAASNKLLQASVFDDAMSDMKKANEILVSTMAENLNSQLQNFITSNISQNISDKFNLFDKKFTDTVVDKYEEIKLISSKYNTSFVEIEAAVQDLLSKFVVSKDEINKTITTVLDGINGSLDELSLSFADLKTQILNKAFDEAFQTSVNNQIQGLEDLIREQFGYLEDITDLCGANLPELTEMNAVIKYSVLQAIEGVNSKLEAQDTSVQNELNNLKTDIITQFLNIFNQISFVAEQEEILDFIQEKHSELITVLSHIVTTIDDVSTVKDNLAVVDNKVDTLKEDIDLINEKITSIISSDGDIDYVYSLQDLESDIANLRLSLNEIKQDNKSKELEELISSTNDIYELVDSIKKEIPNFNTEEFKKDFDALNEDIVSISTRTNKLILASDESYKTLQENLQDFKLVINDLDERTRNFAQDAGLDKIDNKLGAINTMIQNGAKTNQVFNQVFEYLAEWVDNAGAQITSISDKVETLDDIGQIKVMLEDLKAEAEDNSDSAELIEALSNVFDKQAKKIASLEAKLDRVIVETTINNKNNKIDMSPLEETLNRFLVAIDDKMSSQQDKINSLESKLEDVAAMFNPKDTAQLTKKVGGMDRQIAKLNKSIEKIASHVVEK